MIIAVTGQVIDKDGNKGSAGAGKTTVADRLVDKHSYVLMSLADPMKRFVMDLFDWAPEVLWGETELKNKPDKRYQRKDHGYAVSEERFIGRLGDAPSVSDAEVKELVAKAEADMYLTPRLALQRLGSEWGRELYPGIWVEYGIRTATQLLKSEGQLYYTPQCGLGTIRESNDAAKMVHGPKPLKPSSGVVFADLRFKNEVAAFKRLGAKVIRVVRPVEELFIDNAHSSENDLNDVPDEEFDYVIHGKTKDVPDLQQKTDEMLLAFEKEARCP